MSEAESAVENKAKKLLMVGCIDPQAKDVIDQQLNKRLAELDSGGLQASFIMRLKSDLDIMPSCEIAEEEEKQE